MQATQKALWRLASGETAGEETLEAVVADMHTFLKIFFLHSKSIDIFLISPRIHML